MLSLKNITKKYKQGTFKQTALDNVSLDFKDKEFVCIIGPSGSGKTTMLNIIGGLDRYDEGDVLIDGKSTKHFKATDWDSYRNHAIGFVFQNYNLIPHISVLANVEVGMTLSGIGVDERRQRALDVLDKVGLKDHVYKRPNQLSGGQMQRVAIARALANDPAIILADEPTGAIDQETSKQIMNLIQEIAKDKLVIMVTHDEQLASEYATRTVALRDGAIINDTSPYVKGSQATKKLQFKKTAMAFTQAIRLSFNNLRTKKFRTLLTAFAGSIGIIGVALVLSLANGLNNEIDRLEMTTLAEFPLLIERFPIDIDTARGGPPHLRDVENGWEEFPDTSNIFPFERRSSGFNHTNNITSDYVDYVNDLDETLYNEISITRAVDLPVLFEIDPQTVIRLNTGNVRFEPTLQNPEFFDENYTILEGRAPTGKNDLILLVDNFNRLDVGILNALGLDTDVESYDFDDFLGKSFNVIRLDDNYTYNTTTDRFVQESDLIALLQNENNIELTIVGIARANENTLAQFLSSGIKYHPDLVDTFIEDAKDSEIGEAQIASDTSVITGLPLSEAAKTNFLQTLGVISTPTRIQIYPVNFDAKDDIRTYLDAYNDGLPDEERILYTDLASLVTELTSDVIDGVAYVLIAFSAISLIVSSIMIGIITYVSVLERTKEIGILRSLGARKRDIARVFNAETTIIGFVAGSLGVLIAYLLTFPINRIISNLVDGINNLAVLPIEAVFILILISVTLTYISSLIPASIASRKDPVEALRTE